MANSQKVGIANSWSLVEFKNIYGNMKVTNDFTNGETGETFKSCAFVDPTTNKVTLVGFSGNLTSLDLDKSPAEIARDIASQKADLQVVKLESGRYKLCKKGSNNWASVEL